MVGEQAFIVYKLATLLFGATPVPVPMPGYRHDLKALRAAVTPKTRIVFLASPNNPTGGTDAPADILALAASLPEDVIFCLDEAYAEYLDASADLRPLMQSGRKVVVSRTFSKAYGLAGLRVGYLMGSPEVVALLNRVRQPFNVNLPALAAAEAALDDEAFVRRTREVNSAGIAQLKAGLARLGCEVIDGHANFLAARIPEAEGPTVARTVDPLTDTPLTRTCRTGVPTSESAMRSPSPGTAVMARRAADPWRTATRRAVQRPGVARTRVTLPPAEARTVPDPRTPRPRNRVPDGTPTAGDLTSSGPSSAMIARRPQAPSTTGLPVVRSHPGRTCCTGPTDRT